MPTLASNKKAYFSFRIDDSLEGGLVLYGHEVKSAKNGQISLNGAYVSILGGEAYLKHAYIGKYQYASKLDGYDENRDRKVLLKKSQILELTQKTHEKGTALIPLEIYTKKSLIKVKIGIGKGKKQFDKRESIKKKESKRKIERAVRNKV